MATDALVDLSRLQFAATAMYHFLFVPLTLGMTWILVIMEAVYVMTGKTVYRDMTQFWGKLFGINFALGVTTGITMEFQFGTNWAYYSHYVGDVFGAPLAIEGLMAFFLESTLIGIFFFGWNRLPKTQHLAVTVLMATATSLSALWILIANGWMQNPVGSEFSFVTMRMEMTDFWAVLFNHDAQAKFVHTVSARLCDRRGFRAGDLLLLPPQGPRRGIRQAQLPYRRRLWLCLGLLGDRAGRRVRLLGQRSAADQARRHGSHVGHGESARRPSTSSRASTKRR